MRTVNYSIKMANHCSNCGKKLEGWRRYFTVICRECHKKQFLKRVSIVLFSVGIILVVFVSLFIYFGQELDEKKITIIDLNKQETKKVTLPKVETCVQENFIHKITSGDKPVMNINCSRNDTERICTDLTAILRNCKRWETRSTCVEQTTECYIKVKNYEQEVGRFGYQAYFENVNGKLDKGIIYKDIYPKDEEIFKWTFVHPPEQMIGCSVREVVSPKKKVCK